MKSSGFKKGEIKKFISENWRPTRLTWIFMGIFLGFLVIATAIMAAFSYPFSDPPLISNDYLALIVAAASIVLIFLYYKYSKKTYAEGFNLAVGITLLDLAATILAFIGGWAFVGFEGISLAYLVFALPLSVVIGIFTTFGTYVVVKEKRYVEAITLFVIMVIVIFFIENLKLYSPLNGFEKIYYDIIPASLGRALILGIPAAACVDWFKKNKRLNVFYGAVIIGVVLTALALVKTGGLALVSLGDAMQLQSIMFVEKIKHYYGLDYLAIFGLTGLLALGWERIKGIIE